MKQTSPLLIFSVIFFFFSGFSGGGFSGGKSAQANFFEDVFDSLTSYSRSTRFSRHRRFRRRLRRRREARKWRYYKRRASARRFKSRRRFLRWQKARQRARRRLAKRKRFHALRRRKIAQRRASQRRAEKRRKMHLAKARIVRNKQLLRKQRRFRKKTKQNKRLAFRPSLRPAIQQSRADKKAQRARLRQKPKLKRERKVVAKAVSRNRVVEQARGVLSYGRRDRIALNRAEKKQVQWALSQSGFYEGGIDGMFGQKTRSAIAAYQVSVNQTKTGRLNSVQMAALLRAVSVSKNDVARYLPQKEQKIQKHAAIIRRAKALNDRLKAEASEQEKPKIRAVNKVHHVAEKKALVKVKDRDRAPKPVKNRIPKKINSVEVEKYEMQRKARRKSLFSKISKPSKNIEKRALTPHVKQTRLQTKKGVRKVDYFHILTQTQRGENLWVVKCLDKNKLKLYYWREQKWWVKGKNGGAIGHSEYGKNGIQKLAHKVCTL